MKGRSPHGPKLEVSIAYIHGRIEAQIDAFAGSLEIPPAYLASRLGSLLLGQEDGEVVGTEHHLPVMPRKTVAGGKTVAKVAVDGGTHRGSTQKAYWANMTPQQRSAEWKRRFKKWPPAAKLRWKKWKKAA